MSAPVPSPSPGDILMAARVADHRAHCASCSGRAEEAEARYAAYGESFRRVDRLTLGLHAARRTTVTS
ncbi:hypothetical protein ACWCPF_25975 [Streptomyces sp. NPDC001858]